MPETKSRFLNKILDNKSTEPEELKGFTAERQHTAQAFNLHIERRDGRLSEGFAWSHYVGYEWRDEGDRERLIVVFGMRAVEIEGHNLGVLVAEIREGQLNGIRELASGQAQLLQQGNPENQPVIESVRSYPDFQEILKGIKEKTNMTLDSLAKLEDAELRAIIGRADELLKQHDTERKDKALAEARATLAAVGLTLKDLARKAPAKSKGPVYHSGRTYQHPTNKALTWPGKGKKPGWLTALEIEGKSALEVN